MNRIVPVEMCADQVDLEHRQNPNPTQEVSVQVWACVVGVCVVGVCVVAPVAFVVFLFANLFCSVSL